MQPDLYNVFFFLHIFSILNFAYYSFDMADPTMWQLFIAIGQASNCIGYNVFPRSVVRKCASFGDK